MFVEVNGYPNRKNPRIKSYNYKSPGYYFVAICTWEKQHYFGTTAQLSAMGKCAFMKLQNHFSGVRLEKYVVMPNHVHAIIVLENGERDLSAMVGSYKSYVTKRVHEIVPGLKLWQVSFHDHVIRNERAYQEIWSYIDTNVLRWEQDCFYG